MTSGCCEIQWFDEIGTMTVDDNPSIGRVRMQECDYPRPRGETVHLRASRWFNICAEHARRLHRDAQGNWRLDVQKDVIVWEWEADERDGHQRASQTGGDDHDST
jgi:hypothetical protein